MSFWIIKRRWDDNIKRDIGEIKCRGVDYIQVAQNMAQWRTFMYTVRNKNFEEKKTQTGSLRQGQNRFLNRSPDIVTEIRSPRALLFITILY